MLNLISPMNDICRIIAFFNGITYIIFGVGLIVMYNKPKLDVNTSELLTSIILFLFIGILSFLFSIITCDYRKKSYTILYE